MCKVEQRFLAQLLLLPRWMEKGRRLKRLKRQQHIKDIYSLYKQFCWISDFLSKWKAKPAHLTEPVFGFSVGALHSMLGAMDNRVSEEVRHSHTRRMIVNMYAHTIPLTFSSASRGWRCRAHTSSARRGRFPTWETISATTSASTWATRSLTSTSTSCW